MLEAAIFHNYDLRGVWGKEWDKVGAEKIARAAAAHFKPKKVALARDMRLSSEEIFSAFCRSFVSLGVEVWDYGLVSTDISYFISGKWRPDLTIMITASHNPPEYNGLKITLPGGESISLATGFAAIKELALSGKLPLDAQVKGRVLLKDAYPEYVKAVLSLAETEKIRPLKIVVDAGNGMAGKVLPRVFADLPVKVVPLYFDLDGSFPHHLANPLLPEALETLKKRVLAEKADLGVGFDGDGDRMVLLDERGEVFSGTIMTAILAEHFLKKNPGRAVCYNAICGRVVSETIRRWKGVPVRTPVGYSIIKKIMREKKAIFAGEHSCHFFFPSLYYADSGTAALLLCLQVISQSGQPASRLRKKFSCYFQSGEINFTVADKEEVMRVVEEKFVRGEGKIDHLDGVTISFADWWFNLRSSNTQPVLRLNIEAERKEILEEKKRFLLNLLAARGAKRSFE